LVPSRRKSLARFLPTPTIGVKPRDHVKVSVESVSPNMRASGLSYERGSLPPAFQFVDNKLALSLMVKVK